MVQKTDLKPHNPIFLELAQFLAKPLAQTAAELTEGELIQLIYHQLSEPPEEANADIALGLFPFAKILKSSPVKLAQELAEKLAPKLSGHHLIEQMIPAGPYLNFIIRENVLGNEILCPILKGHFFKNSLLKSAEKTMVEYSQPNTHKILHVGHMRNLCLGNALVNILRYIGSPVVAATYPGDVGTHVAKCLWYLKKENLTSPEKDRGAWLGEIYAKAHERLENEKGTPKEEVNRSELTEILKQLEKKSGPYFDLWKETREWSIDLMKKAYEWADVEFDRWFFESEVDGPSLQFAQKLLSDGKLIKDHGAVGMDLGEDNLGFCLLIKSDGTGLYATKDVELARRKFEEFKIKRNIYIVDNRQAHHFKQVFKVLEKIGFPQAQDCFHLAYEVVELPDGAMSSRKGNIVPLMDLINDMESMITKNYLEKYRGDWSDEEIQQTARQLANGAIKFGMVRVDNNRKIIFSMKEWLKLDGETGPYLQYVCARIKSLCHKQNYQAIKNDLDFINWHKLKEPIEKKLLLKLMLFNKVTAQCYLTLKTHHLTSYLYDLGKLFNQFYTQCPIGKLEDEQLKAERLHLAQATEIIIEKGLGLLGISTPNRM